MKSTCIVPGCHNHSDNGKPISYYSFPADETLRQIWADWVHSLPVSHNTVLPHDFEDGQICSVHFATEDDISIPSIHLPPHSASLASTSAIVSNEAEDSNMADPDEDNTVDTNHFGSETNPETEPEPETEGEGGEVTEPQTEDPSDEEDELPLHARIKQDKMSDYEPEEDEEDDDDPSFDPSNASSKVIQPVTGGRGRKARSYSESSEPPKRPGRGRPPKNKAAPPKEPKRNKRKSQPKKVTKKPTKRELKMRQIEYDTDEENNQNTSNQVTAVPPQTPEIPESIMLSLNSSNSRITALTEEIENCHKIIKEKNEVMNKLNLNINELSSKLKYFTQSEFSIKLTSVITEASKGDTRAVYLLDQIRKYNSVAASNTVYVSLPSTSAALSTAAAQSVIQEQIQQQQQQTTQRSSSSHSNHNAAHQQQHTSQQAQAQAQQQAAQQQAQQQAAAAAAAQQQAVAAAAAAVNNNALYNQYQQSLAAQQLQLPFQTFTADHLAYHNQRFQ